MSTNLWIGLSPLLVVAAGTVLLMLTEALSRLRLDHEDSPSASLATLSAITLFASACASAAVWMIGPEKLPELSALVPYLVIDRFSLLFFVVLSLGALMSALLAGGYLPEHKLDRGEFYPLVLLSTLGAMALCASADLVSVFISLEIMSLGVYGMVAFRRSSPRSVEAALKYFLLGSFAAALLLYGGALIYGATGYTDFASIGAQIQKIGTGAPSTPVLAALENAVPLIIIGFVLILIGLAFKVSAVPFHMWTPDAYEGAPTPATTFMAVAVKTAAFALMVRVLLVAFGDTKLLSWGAGWPPIVATLAVLTMTVSNVIAGRQDSVKRMLAYSSIAHAGYLLVAVVAAARLPADATASIMFYLLVYTVSTVGAFGTLILCGSRDAEAVSYEDLAGIGRRHPAIALSFSLFLLSLAGIPPTAGFFGKLYVFSAAISGGYTVLAIIGLLNSVISAYYYLRVLVFMYMKDPMEGAPIAKPMRSGYVAFALVLAALLVLALGILPDSALSAVLTAARS